MARGRIISKSLGSSRKFHTALQAGGKLGEFCQVLYPLIVSNTDDFGRMPGDAFTIKNVVLPTSRRPEADFDRALDVLHAVGLILRYVVDGVNYLQVQNFRAHQPGLHQRGESSYPDPCRDVREKPATAGNVVLREGKGREEKVSEGKGTEGAVIGARRDSDLLFDRFWAAYPKKRSRPDAQKAWDKRRPNAALLDVMLIAIEAQRRTFEWQKQKGEFIPYPATWLNKARWTDVVEPEVDDLSDTARYNLAASEEAEKLILEAEARRTGTHGHRR